jgi:hypothetical protein
MEIATPGPGRRGLRIGGQLVGLAAVPLCLRSPLKPRGALAHSVPREAGLHDGAQGALL